jgi:hypothetical protein
MSIHLMFASTTDRSGRGTEHNPDQVDRTPAIRIAKSERKEKKSQVDAQFRRHLSCGASAPVSGGSRDDRMHAPIFESASSESPAIAGSGNPGRTWAGTTVRSEISAPGVICVSLGDVGNKSLVLVGVASPDGIERPGMLPGSSETPDRQT